MDNAELATWDWVGPGDNFAPEDLLGVAMDPMRVMRQLKAHEKDLLTKVRVGEEFRKMYPNHTTGDPVLDRILQMRKEIREEQDPIKRVHIGERFRQWYPGQPFDGFLLVGHAMAQCRS